MMPIAEKTNKKTGKAIDNFGKTRYDLINDSIRY